MNGLSFQEEHAKKGNAGLDKDLPCSPTRYLSLSTELNLPAAVSATQTKLAAKTPTWNPKCHSAAFKHNWPHEHTPKQTQCSLNE